MGAIGDTVGWNNFYIPKLTGAALVSYIGSDLLSRAIWGRVQTMPTQSFGRRFAERYMPHHSEIGTSVMITGVLAHGREISPYLIGGGAGLIANDITDFAKQQNRLLTTLFPKRDIARNLGKYADITDGMDIHITDIPDVMGRRYRYTVIANVLKSIVNEWTYNRVREVWIPPGHIHPAVVSQARAILRKDNIDGRDTERVAAAIQKWTQDNIGYVLDPHGTDYYVHPYILLTKMKEGDCDEHATLTGSLLKALDVPARLTMVAQHSKRFYNHILTEAKVGDKWVPLETTRKVPYGTEMKGVLLKGIIPL